MYSIARAAFAVVWTVENLLVIVMIIVLRFVFQNIYRLGYDRRQRHAHKPCVLANRNQFGRTERNNNSRAYVVAADKQVEAVSCEKLLALLPEELAKSYRPLLTESEPDVAVIVKAADKLSAYIKCIEELKAGNSEFSSAAKQTRQALEEMRLPCLDYFMEHFLESFKLTLDELE